jgi:DNA-binding response OmpR family regulator
MRTGKASAVSTPLPNILIVEDEAMVALMLEDFLTDSGFAVTGIAGHLDAALALIAKGATDAAILDANLAGVSSAPAAAALVARGIPFIVVSGYLPEHLPAAFAGALCLQKPCRPDDLIRGLHRVLNRA